MCRWVAYLGGVIRPQELLYAPEHSLIHQSTTSKLQSDAVNGDGFGMGWYDDQPTPALYRTTKPAWHDRNLREISEHMKCEVFLAHVRSTTGAPVQETNCNPFRHGRWMFVHNGSIEGYERVKRDLFLALSPELFNAIEGSTDSELLFYLALTFGLEKEPLRALERMAGFIEDVAARRDIANPLQMTLGLSDGERLYAVRYATGPKVDTLFVSESVEAVRALCPGSERLKQLPSHTRAIVSEPLNHLPGAWIEVAASTAVVVSRSDMQMLPFRPRRDA